MRYLLSLILLTFLLFNGISANLDPGLDLAFYISRPDIRPPLLTVTRNEVDEVSPGYWFMAPYANLVPDKSAAHEFTPYQAGPHIYDRNGHLVWSGALFVENRNTFDFRVGKLDGNSVLTFISWGVGYVLDSNYDVHTLVNFTEGGVSSNFHEFKLLGNKTSLSVFEKAEEVDISPLNLGSTRSRGRISHNGFHEIDVVTGEVLFKWWPMPQVSLEEVMVPPPPNFGVGLKDIWDCFHTNALDKDQFGNYLVSMRYTSTIYKISPTGDIIWRLGGRFSNFTQDFNFSSQHDAKFFYVNETMTIISFLDNASDERNRQPSTSSTSAIKLVALDETTMTAQLLRSWPRPDGRLTKLRGTAQLLENGGVFACWSDQGYISEFAPEGHCVLEAKYTGARFSSYRAYKFDFVGRPTEPPALVVHAYPSSRSTMSSVFYVSWNGATEVSHWTFYGTNDLTQPYQVAGTATKAGFETSFVSRQLWSFSYAEAYDVNGIKLGTSNVVEVVLPNENNGNLTLASLNEQEKVEDQMVVLKASQSALVASGIIFAVTATGLIGVCVFIWKRQNAGRRRGQKYEAVLSDEGQIEEEQDSLKEKAPLVRDEGVSDDEDIEEEQKDVVGVASLPRRAKRGHARTTSVDVELNSNPTREGTGVRRAAFSRLASFTLLPSTHQIAEQNDSP